MLNKKIITLVLSASLLGATLTACANYRTVDVGTTTTTETETVEESEAELHHVAISVAGYGTIEVELNATVAPITVANFISLAESGFYDGITFHRIMNGFMIQGGDPEGTGLGGSGTTIVGEFANNGHPNSISHVRGTISMARNSISMDSASSQFFICQADATYLDGDYAAFGTVTSGMDVVDRICQEVPVIDSNGGTNPEDRPVISSIVVID